MFGEYYRKHTSRVRISVMLVVALVLTLVLPEGVTTGTKAASTHEGGVFRGIVTDGSIVEVSPEDIKSARVTSRAYRTSDSGAVYSVRADATPATDPYKLTIADNLGEMMTEQLTAAFTNSAGTQATISSVSPSLFANSSNNVLDINSSITFRFDSSMLRDGSTTITSSQDILPYVEQAISRYPRLCCLFTLVYLSYNSSGQSSLTVYSPIKAGELYSTTLEYETALDDILKVPNSNPTMSDVEKLLYMHDEVVALTEYSYRNNLYAIDYVPAGTVVYNTSVCQSYAAVMNHLARRQGLVSYVLDSDTHAWNAVQLGGAWYYIDTTWDDSSVSGADAVNHYYFMVAKSRFDSAHDLDSFYSSVFSAIPNSSMGTAYDSYLPKQANSGSRVSQITSEMGYTGGYFYYSKNNRMYRWNGSGEEQLMSTVDVVSNRRTAVCGGTVYISGGDGLYSCNSTITATTKLSTKVYTGMYEAAGKLYVNESNGSFYIYKNASSPITTPTPNPNAPTATPAPSGSTSPSPSASALPSGLAGIPTVPPTATASATATPAGATATPKPAATATPKATSAATTIKTPAKATIKTVKNIKTRAIEIKWKKVKNASRYRVQYSTKKDFSTKQYIDVLTNSKVITNLFKNKTYYVRVRAVKIARINGKIKYAYGKWSSKKKVKVTK